MSAGRDVERLLSDWFALEAPARAPDRVLEQATSAIDRTKQRRFGAAWRERFMELALRRAVVPRPLIYLGLVALLILALTAALLLVGANRQRLPAPFGPASNGAIAYDTGGRIYLAQADGTVLEQVSGGHGYNMSPAFSPDGTKIAFWSRQAPAMGPMYLFVGPADGSAPVVDISHKVAMVDPEFVPPTWAPDGSRIAFTGHAPSGGENGIFVANVDGSGVQKIAEGNIRTGYPRWSPDGRWIAFRTEQPDATGLDVVQPDGSQRREIVSVPGIVDAFTFMHWSPDSTRIAYHADTNGRMVVGVTDLDGRVTELSKPGENGQTPGWSSDGSLIAYDADPTGLVVVAPDGTGRRELGRIAACGMWFSPDSKFLIAHPPECFTDALVVVPIDDPAAAQRLELPGPAVGMPSWQRVHE